MEENIVALSFYIKLNVNNIAGKPGKPLTKSANKCKMKMTKSFPWVKKYSKKKSITCVPENSE